MLVVLRRRAFKAELQKPKTWRLLGAIGIKTCHLSDALTERSDVGSRQHLDSHAAASSC